VLWIVVLGVLERVGVGFFEVIGVVLTVGARSGLSFGITMRNIRIMIAITRDRIRPCSFFITFSIL
jgi:hypothetical protein